MQKKQSLTRDHSKPQKHYIEVASASRYSELSMAGILPDDPDLRVIRRARMKMIPEERDAMMRLLRERFPEEFAEAESDGD